MRIDLLVVIVAAVCGVLSVVFNHNDRPADNFLFLAYTILLSAVIMECMTLWVG